MTIPAFPNFRPLEISDGAVFHASFAKHPPIISEYTFTNLFAWMAEYDFHISHYKNALLILTQTCGKGGIYPPVGLLSVDDFLKILRDCIDQNIADHFHCADEKIVEMLRPFASQQEIIEEPDQFDYVYLRDDLVNLAGNKFHDKKNLLRQFEKKNDASFEIMSLEMIKDIIDFEHSWCVTRECEKDPKLSKEKCAIYRMLSYFEILKLTGAIVRVEGKIVGITMGEPLNNDTFVIHVEKADDKYRGIYQFINQRFATSIDPKYKYINREQDLGIDGLRRAKKSYNPIRMEKKYIVRLKN